MWGVALALTLGGAVPPVLSYPNPSVFAPGADVWVVNDKARLRSRPSKDAPAEATLRTGAVVRIASRGSSESIGGRSAPWYRVTANSQSGFIWGGTLTDRAIRADLDADGDEELTLFGVGNAMDVFVATVDGNLRVGTSVGVPETGDTIFLRLVPGADAGRPLVQVDFSFEGCGPHRTFWFAYGGGAVRRVFSTSGYHDGGSHHTEDVRFHRNGLELTIEDAEEGTVLSRTKETWNRIGAQYERLIFDATDSKSLVNGCRFGRLSRAEAHVVEGAVAREGRSYLDPPLNGDRPQVAEVVGGDFDVAPGSERLALVRIDALPTVANYVASYLVVIDGQGRMRGMPNFVGPQWRIANCTDLDKDGRMEVWLHFEGGKWNEAGEDFTLFEVAEGRVERVAELGRATSRCESPPDSYFKSRLYLRGDGALTVRGFECDCKHRCKELPKHR